MMLKVMQKVLPNYETPNGSRAFTNSEDFRQNVLAAAVSREMDEIRTTSNDPDKCFTPQELFVISERIKNRAWADLSPEQQQEWSAKAKDLNNKWKDLD